MPSRARATALGFLLISGLLIAGCGEPLATPPGSTPVPSATASASDSSTDSATPVPTMDSESTSTSAESTSPSAESMSPSESTTTVEPSRSNSDDESETYGIDLSIAGSKLRFIPMRWYFGKDALARCQKQGIEPEGAWCNDFYYEKAGDRVSARLAEDVRIRVLTKDAKLRPGTRAQLDRAISETIWPHFQIQLANGEAVAITQVYTP